jgi:hypothetical protein
MTESQPQTTDEAQSAPTPATEIIRVGHQTPGLVLVPHRVDGVVSMKTFSLDDTSQPIELMHSESGQPLTWSDVACTNTAVAVSGWYPGKLGGWVKLGDWRDGGFEADAWSSDGSGMKTYVKPRAKLA